MVWSNCSILTTMDETDRNVRPINSPRPTYRECCPIFKVDHNLWKTSKVVQYRTPAQNRICSLDQAAFASCLPRAAERSNPRRPQRSPPPALGPSLCSHQSKQAELSAILIRQPSACVFQTERDSQYCSIIKNESSLADLRGSPFQARSGTHADEMGRRIGRSPELC